MVDERTVVADLKSYVDKLPNFRGSVEEHIENIKRMDLKVEYKNKVLFNGEFKKPFVIEGKTPRDAKLIFDAFNKANSSSPTTMFFITSNMNETVVWDNRDNTRPLMSRDIKTFYLSEKIEKDEDLSKTEVKESLQQHIEQVCDYIRDLYEGKLKATYRTIGESFIEGLNEHLNSAVELVYRYIDVKTLTTWWAEQGYLDLMTDNDKKRRMARFSLYALGNKIAFYYVLKRSFSLPELLPKYDPNNEESIGELKDEISKVFKDAQKLSGDYENVFKETYADQILFKSNDLVHSLTSLILFFKGYDFSGLSQDILGNIYDRLISPEERHKNGQYYTPIPVVDLMNSIVMERADDTFLDPACGSGTFLTRAFELKLRKGGLPDSKENKERILKEIFGVEIASYPARLATVALASKLVVSDPKLYPNVIEKDFLETNLADFVPKWRMLDSIKYDKAVNLSNADETNVVMENYVDVVSSNLPYIKAGKIESKEHRKDLVINNLKNNGFSPVKISKNADFHVYFWYFVLPLIKNGSKIAFLTSDTWLNVKYGHELKKFINKYFKLTMVIESSIERWFSDALVNTVITVLERDVNRENIDKNKVKFIRINDKLTNFITNLDDAIRVADSLKKGTYSSQMELIREVKQDDLFKGPPAKLGKKGKSFAELEEEANFASKLFPFLRGPAEFFQLIKSESMVPLKKILKIMRGFTTGANDFFYVTDVTKNYTDAQKKSFWGLLPGEIKNSRIVRSGDGSLHLIEKEYLRPFAKSPKDFTKRGRLILSVRTERKVLVINEEKKENIKKYALKYIEWGESNPHDSPYSLRPSLKHSKAWWKLRTIFIPEIALPDQLSWTYLYPKTDMLLDKKLYCGAMKKEYKGDFISVYSFLNSTLSFLYPDLYGRPLGGGSTGTAVYEYENIPVPNPKVLRPNYERLKELMSSLENRKINTVFNELGYQNEVFSIDKVKKDRLELDVLILKSLGFEKPKEFLMKWYPAVIKLLKERATKASSVPNSKAKKKISYQKMAKDIIKTIEIKQFPEDYVSDVAMKTRIPSSHEVSYGRDLSGNYVNFDGKKEYYANSHIAEFIYFCAKLKKTEVDIPTNIEQVLSNFKSDLGNWEEIINSEIDKLTSSQDAAEKLKKTTLRLTGYF